MRAYVFEKVPWVEPHDYYPQGSAVIIAKSLMQARRLYREHMEQFLKHPYYAPTMEHLVEAERITTDKVYPLHPDGDYEPSVTLLG